MKKLMLIAVLLSSFILSSYAEKIALLDMEYILTAIPSYETANDQLEQLSKKWEKEVEDLLTETQNMYKNYQTEKVFLSKEMITKRENAIVAKENEANELKRKYFGPKGELFKKRESLIKPIQEEIYNAVKKMAQEKGYDMILDKASSRNIIFASPKLDISDDLLLEMGYSTQK